MNPNTDELSMARWLDGEMPAEERTAFEARLQSDAALRAEVEGLQSLRAALQAGFTKHSEVPHADFFNSQIQQRIVELRREEDAGRERAPLFGWLRIPWLALGAAAACALVAIVMLQTNAPATVVLSTYAPSSHVQARSFQSGEAKATVLMLEGLDEIPADRSVVGFKVHHSETDQDVAMTTLFSDHGDVLLVLAKDGRNQPRIIVH